MRGKRVTAATAATATTAAKAAQQQQKQQQQQQQEYHKTLTFGCLTLLKSRTSFIPSFSGAICELPSQIMGSNPFTDL
jgi:hypothetical protein